MDLNTILIILGVIALLALIAHGIWSNRREKSEYFKNANTFSPNQQSNHFNVPPAAHPTTKAPHVEKPASPLVEETAPQQQTLDFETATPSINEAQSIDRAVDEIKITLPNGTSNTTLNNMDSSPQYSFNEVSHVHSQPTSTQNDAPYTYSGEASSYAESNVASLPSMSALQKEEQHTPRVSLADNEHQQPLETQPKTPSTESRTENADKTSFIMLYVVAPENREFNGGRLAQALDGLGFIFGDQNIYHRHLDLTAASPVLFSVANLQQPGTFDPYDMDNLFTVGIAIFMQLPSPGNDMVNLKTMIRAARNLADELGGFVLTDKQEIFNDVAEQEYLAKVA